jgi:putative ABC transport system substrate-binding protein
MSLGRRDVLCLALALFPGWPEAQVPPAAKIYRIGWLGTAHTDAEWDQFIEGLRERGWIEGKNLAFERLYSDGRSDRFPALAAQLVARNVDLIVAVGTQPAVAARDATTTIPITFFYVGDPVGSGLVASLARPDRNLTGLGGFAAGLHVKQLELLKEMIPKASRIAMFVNDGFPLHTVIRAEIEPAARKLGVTLIPIPAKVPQDIDVAFATVAREKIDALILLGQPMIGANSARVAKLALDHRMAAISTFDFATEAGLLMSYGSRIVDDARRLPYYVDRIFRGATPAELPVELPTRFYLVINLRTADAIGVSVPRSMLARADQLIQ